jgi:poly(hydroxyalkanoate) depolymerase family esterase
MSSFPNSGPFRFDGRAVRRMLDEVSDLVSFRWITPSDDEAERDDSAFALEDFGSNPGDLRMLVHAPASARTRGAPVVVLLHGCGQEPIEFARHAGWIALADRLGCILVMPEQLSENNHSRCFQWFRPADAERGRGEALSIRQMVAAALRRFDADPRAVYVAGLSAGGAMAASLLAGYPEVFAAGAVVAGLPVGCATNASQALSRMARAEARERPEKMVEQARDAAPQLFNGPWPRLSIWHGKADRVVDPANAGVLATQFAGLHGVEALEATAAPLAAPKAERLIWGDPARPAVERWIIEDMGHGMPIAAGDTASAAPFVLDVGIDAAALIARFWEIG